MKDYNKELTVYGIYMFISSMTVIKLEVESVFITTILIISYALILIRACVILVMKMKGRL